MRSEAEARKQSPFSELMEMAGNHKYFSYVSYVLAALSAWWHWCHSMIYGGL